MFVSLGGGFMEGGHHQEVRGGFVVGTRVHGPTPVRIFPCGM
jgi:hypothetical protein